MQTSGSIISISSAWFMAVVYHKIEVATGLDFKILLGAAIIALAVGLYCICRNSKGITKEEA